VLYSLVLIPSGLFTIDRPAIPNLSVDLLLCICGLVSLEQLVRNARIDLRWRLRYLNIGLSLIFGFGGIHAALSLLFGAPVLEMAIVQPAVLALAVPLIVIASLRNRDQALNLNVSREFVFRTGVLLTAGAILLLLALAGYYVRIFGGGLANAILALLATLIIAGAAIVMGSTRFQSRLRRFVNESFYERKHDYRDVWGLISNQLTEPSADFSLPQQGIRGVLSLLDSPSGALWLLSDAGTLIPEAQLHTSWNSPYSPDSSRELTDFFSEKEWIIDLEEPPQEFDDSITEDLSESFPSLRYLIPLTVQGKFVGLIGTTDSSHPRRLEWEDFDVLKLVSRQTAGFLALEKAGGELGDAQQLHAMNRLTAFLIHDLKTISAQLTLLLENAVKHKTNPAFIDDMLLTVGNTNTKMQKLIEQVSDRSSARDENINVSQLLSSVLEKYNLQAPRLSVDVPDELIVQADESRLASVIGHTVQNAFDAGGERGCVMVTVKRRARWAEISVRDTGRGMDRDFIENQLFTPFESTKGVTGMGIGAYQTREYLRSIGGDVEVRSEIGVGSEFILRIPIVTE
jgi:putative PEP-CTERM system histidine kinase